MDLGGEGEGTEGGVAGEVGVVEREEQEGMGEGEGEVNLLSCAYGNVKYELLVCSKEGSTEWTIESSSLVSNFMWPTQATTVSQLLED